jgi:DNA-binding transcriptional LysR family regulator
MRLRYIEIFQAVMQAGTVKGAADLLHITQPAATRLLQQAECNVRVALFQRVRGRLMPTAEALRLYPAVEQLYDKLDAVRRVAGNLDLTADQPLRVLCTPGLALVGVPQALGEWSRRFSTVCVSLRTLHSRQIAESLTLREADIGFAFESAPHPVLLSEPIAQAHFVCVGPDVPAQPIPISALREHEVIDLDPGDPLGQVLHAALTAHDVVPPSRMLTHSYHAAIELAAAGFGWALVDSLSAVHAQRHPGLRVTAIEPAINVAVYALRPRDVPASAAADALAHSVGMALQR